jgi:chromosomal replication initiation ATPase DnaA
MQIPLPLETPARLSREDFIAGPGNSAALGMIDAWPNWPAPAAALFGPAGSGKTHLAGVWAARAQAQVVVPQALDTAALAAIAPHQPLAIEDVDHAPLPPAAETALFVLIERGQSLLLTGRETPAAWPVQLPDLSSRYRALLAFPLWAPDDGLLAALAKKLFADRQLAVPDAVVSQMVRLLERSPAAIRDFVAKADAAALSQKRPVTPGFIRELLGKQD